MRYESPFKTLQRECAASFGCDGLSTVGSSPKSLAVAYVGTRFTKHDTKNPFVASSPGEHRISDSARPVHKSGMSPFHLSCLRICFRTWRIHLFPQTSPLPKRQGLFARSQYKVSIYGFLCFQGRRHDVLVLSCVDAAGGVDDPFDGRN